ncbi:hypothetical protein FF011L_02720 [Roseimaritima multifibrata]|uniref:Uncharacterized protein n=1 Tax=Roseimaritima multifibrata TaxID=1930274 RepID=A0A517M9I4_9BACT|nr:hypothetical protein FF011L_02720 [Roseimaritima multifibrata]
MSSFVFAVQFIAVLTSAVLILACFAGSLKEQIDSSTHTTPRSQQD